MLLTLVLRIYKESARKAFGRGGGKQSQCGCTQNTQEYTILYIEWHLGIFLMPYFAPFYLAKWVGDVE